MKMGFTGTRKGMSDWQKKRLRQWLRDFRPDEFHHGDCVGADAQAHKLVREVLPDCKVVIHPGDMPRLRANCKGDIILAPLQPLHRNRLIVAAVDEMVATPEVDAEQERGGTWFTIRAAREAGKFIEVIEREQPPSTGACKE
jgi:hypothetical protein